MPQSNWQKSSYCAQGNSCVYVASDTSGSVHLTESSDPTGAILTAAPVAFAALIHNTKRAEPTFQDM
ncbi:DUF397 domain-containing protein [Streptomyces sp. NPDC003006]